MAIAETNSITGLTKIDKDGLFFDNLDQEKIQFVSNGKVLYEPNRKSLNYSTNFVDIKFTYFKSDVIHRAFILLHELGHITGESKSDNLNIQFYDFYQAENNDNVINNCFKVNIINLPDGTKIRVIE
jgi:hypothetical protein